MKRKKNTNGERKEAQKLKKKHKLENTLWRWGKKNNEIKEIKKHEKAILKESEDAKGTQREK